MHGLAKVNGIKNLDVVIVLFQGISALNDDTALGVSNHIRAVHLEQVRLQPETGLAGTGAADD